MLIAKTLAASRHRVFATLREIDGRNASAARDLVGWASEKALALDVLELDVASDASVQQAVEQIVERAGGVDVVVNNAGVSAFGPLEAYTPEQMMSLLSINVLGPMRVSSAVLPGMRRQRSGLIIWITSTLGRVLPGIGGLYPATKWAAEGFAESLHYQLAPFGIDVVILEPGSFPTPAVWKSVEPARTEIVNEYALAAPSEGAKPVQPAPGYTPPDPQEVADAVKRIIDTPPGQRALREVVGPVFTEGVADYNQVYLQLRETMIRALARPDQAITWTPEAHAAAASG
jgi:NAD(P)-dependent dehydrogenase (short-subunit alcohol dehydrogenase family)